jgi:3'-5' exoribonuclease
MRTLSNAFDTVSNEPWLGYLAIKGVEKRVAKNGSPFVKIVLGDNHVSVVANIWEDRAWYKPLADGSIKAGDHVKVMGKVSVHSAYGRQIDLLNLRPVEPRDESEGYRPEDLLEKAPADLEACAAEVETVISHLEPAPLRATVEALFAEHGAAFRRAAAARNAHHAFFGGLLHHTTMMLREARALMAVRDFPVLNPSLVLAGILLHDLGKTVELEPYPRSEYTEIGNLLGHTHVVLTWIDRAAREHEFDGPLLLHLKHIILSHHGQHEFGAAVLPQTREALFVHLIDNLDAKMQMVRYALDRLSPGDTVTERVWPLDNRAFRPTPGA